MQQTCNENLNDMNTEKWNEIVCIFSEHIKEDILEKDFDKEVFSALRQLGWMKSRGNIVYHQSEQIGSTKRIVMDFTIKSDDDKYLFIVENKRPIKQLVDNNLNQIKSYMRLYKLEFGVLIGQRIQIVYFGNDIEPYLPIIIEDIKFENNSEKGIKFVELFSKDSFSKESLKEYAIQILKKKRQEEEFANENIRKNTLGFICGLDFNIDDFVVGARVAWDLFKNNRDGTSTTPNYKNVLGQITLGYRFN